MDLDQETYRLIVTHLPFWIWLGSATIILLGGGITLWWFWPKPYIRMSLRGKPELYNLGNLSARMIYQLWCPQTSKRREFVLLRPYTGLNGWFRIGVLPDDGQRRWWKPYQFSGWALCLSSEALVQESDLDSLPNQGTQHFSYLRRHNLYQGEQVTTANS